MNAKRDFRVTVIKVSELITLQKSYVRTPLRYRAAFLAIDRAFARSIILLIEVPRKSGEIYFLARAVRGGGTLHVD